MKTMEKLCARFARLYPDYKIYFAKIESFKGFYRVAITEPMVGYKSYFTFRTCAEFRAWMDGVVLD